MTSDARVRPPEEDDAVPDAADSAESAEDVRLPADDGTADDGTDDDGTDEPAGRSRRKRGRRTGSRLSLPVVPVLGALLALLVAAAAFLWFTRPEPSAVLVGDYAEALQAARSGFVDMTSFDHLTLDDDIEQIRRVATGDLEEEAIAELEDNRQAITESEGIVNTEIVGAGVTRVEAGAATVVMVIQATQESTASPQAQISNYRVQVELQKEADRWVLSGITGR